MNARVISFMISLILILFSFGYFLLNIINLVWFDFIILFLFIGITYYLYQKDKINLDFARIFLAITLFLISYGNSEMYLRFLLNLCIFYALTVFILSQIKISTKEKIRELKKIEYRETVLIILGLFIIVLTTFRFLPLDSQNPYLILAIVLSIFIILGRLKRLAKPHIDKMKDEDIDLINILLFCFLFLFDGGFEFILGFLLLFTIKTAINLTTKINEKAKNHITDSSSIYNFTVFALVFTLLTNKSIIEIILWAFV